MHVVTRQMRSVDVHDRADFDGLLRDLHRHSNTTISIDIGAETSVLADPEEFDELATAALSHNVDVEVVTDDPVRQELASIFGLQALSGADQKTRRVVKLRDVALTRRIRIHERFSDEIPPTQEIRLEPTEEIRNSENKEAGSLVSTQPSFSFVTATAADSDANPSGVRRSRHVAKKEAARRSMGAASIFVSGIVIVVAISALLLALFAPFATITVTPEVRPLTAQVTYGLGGSAENLDVSVEPSLISTVVTYEASIPASGIQTIPDEPARGLIFLTNPFTEPVLVPEGTILTTGDGNISYQTLADVELPAADPFLSARFGTAVVGIEAVEPGPAGNIGLEALTGTHQSGFMFQNRFPVEGGTTKDVAVATASDLETLRSMAEVAIAEASAVALDDQITEGWRMVDDPNVSNDIELQYSTEEGMAAESIGLTASAEVTGLIFDPQALDEAARAALQTDLSNAVPEGFGLVLESIRISESSAPGDDEKSARRMSAVASAEAQFDQEQLDQMKNGFVGKRQSSVETALAGHPGVESYTANFGPEWLPWEAIPRFDSRISIEIDGS